MKLDVTNERIQAMICNPWCYDAKQYPIYDKSKESALFSKVLLLMKFLNRRESDWIREDVWSVNELGLIRNAVSERMNNEEIIRKFRLSGNKKHWKLIVRQITKIRKEVRLSKGAGFTI